MARPDEPTASPATGLVHEGWQHLHLQRPMAAWASWQRALRLDANNEAAQHAIETLAGAVELPAAARSVYRFRNPSDATVRARWDARLGGGDLVELEAAAEAFAALTNDHPADADAWYNLALCRAWNGQNTEAVACLDRVVSLVASDDPGRAAEVWTLAEVIRQGGGAEAIADDVRYAWVVDRPAADLFEGWPNLVPVPMPTDPITGTRPIAGGHVFEWLDRPPGVPASGSDRADCLPRVLATVIRTPDLLRISSPDPAGLAALEEMPIGRALAHARREKTPLPIAWADAALGTFRFPPWLDAAGKASLARSVVEHVFEDLWVHQPRRSLGDLAPLEAARVAARGDVIARVKLLAVVAYREQLGARLTHAAIYQGYPFDRLRRRLDLLSVDESDALDAGDVSSMGERELDGLDPTTLDDHRLADAFSSAAALRDDARTAGFAAALARRPASARDRLDPAAVFAPLVRESLRLGDFEEALDWLKTALIDADRPRARGFTVWSAEIHARSGRPEAALLAYQGLLETTEGDAALALDGAETLLDNGYPDHALPLLLEAQARARRSGDRQTLRNAEGLLGPA